MLREKFNLLIRKIISIILNIICKPLKLKNKIIFEASRGLVDGNTKAIYEYLVSNNINKFKIIWLVSKKTDISSLRDGDYVYYRTLKSYYHLATAKYLIRSQSDGCLLKKKKGQIYIQVWHGNGAMKKMEYDIINAKERKPLDVVKEWDYYIANNPLDEDHIRSATGYDKKVEILGAAAVDITLRLDKDKKFKNDLMKKLNIKEKDRKKRKILYVPTFRDFDLNGKIVKLPIEKMSNLEDSLILVRLHPLVRDKIDKKLFKHKNFINANDYPDASDLLAIADLLITDYSSIFYQFSPLNRPIIFYPYDMEKYIKLRGGFYLDYDKELPGAVCYTEDELIKLLKDEKKLKKYNINQKKFNERCNYLADGNSAKRFVDKLINGYFE